VIDAGPVEAWTVSLSPDGRLVASGSQGGNINLWNVEGGEKQHTFETGGKFAMSVAISPDGTKVRVRVRG
jgi:WD repeat-containing protein 61